MAGQLTLPTTGIVWMDSTGYRYTLAQIDLMVDQYTRHKIPSHWDHRQQMVFKRKFVIPYTQGTYCWSSSID